MLTANQAADEWMKVHSPAEWQALLESYEDVPVLPEEVMHWLGSTLPMFRDNLRSFREGPDLEPAKALARFEDAFIANVSRAIDETKSL